MSTKHTPRKTFTDEEAARELFVAGYLQACEDIKKVMRAIGLQNVDEFMSQFLAKAAHVQAKAAIAKATGSTE